VIQQLRAGVAFGEINSGHEFMRRFALILFASVLASLPATARDLDAKFLIKRAGKVIGYHAVDVSQTDDGIVVDTEISMRVHFGPIPLFKYSHEAREVWREGELLSLVSKTNNNGEKTAVDARRGESGLFIDGTYFKGVAPEGAHPSSYWDKAILNADALINTQTGEIIEISIEKIGETPAPHNQLAEQYRILGTLALNIWYDGEKWVGSHFVIDGEELTYELVANEQQYAALEDWLD